MSYSLWCMSEFQITISTSVYKTSVEKPKAGRSQAVFSHDPQQRRGALIQQNVTVTRMCPRYWTTSAVHLSPCSPLSLDTPAVGLDLWVLFCALGESVVIALALSVILCSALHVYSLHQY